MCSLPHVSLSKALYISTSCPGGLEENSADSVLTSQSNDDSAFEEDQISERLSSLEEGDKSQVSIFVFSCTYNLLLGKTCRKIVFGELSCDLLDRFPFFSLHTADHYCFLQETGNWKNLI